MLPIIWIVLKMDSFHDYKMYTIDNTPGSPFRFTYYNSISKHFRQGDPRLTISGPDIEGPRDHTFLLFRNFKTSLRHFDRESL